MFGTVKNNFSGPALKIEVEKQKVVSAGFGWAKGWPASGSGGLHLNRATICRKSINRFGRPCLNKLYVEQVQRKRFTKIADQIAVQSESKLRRTSPRPELVRVMVTNLITGCN
nr:hypothetical protein [Sphingomonas sp. PAMC 26605]